MARRMPKGYSSAGYRVITPVDPQAEATPESWAFLLDRLEISASSAMAWRLVPRFFQGPRMTHDANWMIFMDAQGEVWADDEALVMNRGDSVFLPPGTRDCEVCHGEREWTMLSIHFTATLDGAPDALRMLGFPLHVPDPDGVLAGIALRMVEEYDTRPAGWHAVLNMLAKDALFHVIRHHAASFRHTRLPEGGLPERLLPALSMIERRMGEADLAVDDLAEAVGLGAVRLRRLFHQAFGITPIAYVRRRRMEQACRLLRDSALSIKEIIHACGFRDVSFFYRVFRSETGMSPAHWRQGGGT